MTKPQAANEPSMEDILASIRKMISEDRLDARPIPDQIARASIGERAAPRPVAKPANEAGAEKVQSGELKAVSAPPAAGVSEPAPPERPVPSFSSLSDALKSAAPGAVRPSLDDKLADMLDGEGKAGANGRESAPPAAPLAVFAGARAKSASPDKPQLHNGGLNGAVAATPLRPELRATFLPDQSTPASATEPRRERDIQRNAGNSQSTLKPVPVIGPGPESAPSDDLRSARSATSAPTLNGSSAHAPAATPTIAKIVEPSREPAKQNGVAAETPSADHNDSPRTTRLSTPQLKRDEPLIVEPKAETQRIIAMPARFSMSSNPVSSGNSDTGINGARTHGAQTNGTTTNGSLSGSRASVFGLRPAGAQSSVTRPLASHNLASHNVEAYAEEPLQVEPTTTEPSLAKPATLVVEAAHVAKAHAADTIEAKVSVVEPKLEAKEPSEALEAFKKAVAAHHSKAASAQPAVEGAVASSPSERLVDAVMELVHAEPHTLSVFTSGASFIHGVAASHGAEETAELPALVLPEEPSSSTVAPKLDRSAAELLRPMLRQWLADNMPRIVEDALRSELMSGQGNETPDKV